MQQRYYDPVIGRFYGNDPLGFIGEIDSFNRYSYVANNPYKYIDPTGELKVDGGTGAALGELIRDIFKNPDDYIPKRVDSKSNIQNNRANGKSFEQHVKNKINTQTPTNVTVSEQVTLRTNDGTNTVMDLVVSDDKSTVCVECKASATAPLTKNQKKAHPLIPQSGAVVRGKGKPAIPGGTIVEPTEVIVVRPKKKR